MCLVEVGETKPDGSVAMQPKVVPGLPDPGEARHRRRHQQRKAKAAQAGTLEYILLDHPLDCPICDQAGECYLQDYSYKLRQCGAAVSTNRRPITPDKHYIGEQIVLFTDRCVMCSRCVRFTREISGTGELQVINRGNHAEIDIFPGKPCNNKLAGNVVDICPVGALCSKDFLYKQRVWWLQVAEQRLPELQHRLQHPRRSEQGPRLSAPPAAQSRGAGQLHVRPRPIRIQVPPSRGSAAIPDRA